MTKEQSKQNFINLLQARIIWLKSRYDSRLKNSKIIDARIDELNGIIEQLKNGDALTMCAYFKY